MEEVDQGRIHVNLRMVDGEAVMNVSRVTDASRGLGLSCGGVLSAEQADTSLVTIEHCQLKPDEFRAWFDDSGLNLLAFGKKYSISPSQIKIWLWGE